MDKIKIKASYLSALKELSFIVFLFLFVLWVNSEILSRDLMYFEQPLIYLANQGIHSLRDLLQIYLHPKLLDAFSIPFFRPSGHFLMYQLFAPLLGWHNTRGFVICNLGFLALSGLLMVKLYKLLFKEQGAGGLLAFSLYLMHPALILSRLIVLHFEFAYVFFVLLSLYAFIRYCQALSKTLWFLAALFSYLLALSFKEPALMLGPVLALNYGLNRPSAGFLKSKQNLQVLFILTLVTLVGLLYLTLPWPSFGYQHPLSETISYQDRLLALKTFINLIFSLPKDWLSLEAIYHSHLLWREVIFPPMVKGLVWFLWTAFSLVVVLAWKRRLSLPEVAKKSLLFLGLSALLFMIMPLQWAMALPWHLSLSLLFIGFIWAYSVEVLLGLVISHKKWQQGILLLLAMAVGLTTFTVNQVNMAELLKREGLAFTLNRNAVFNPPPIESQLNDDSVVVIEDSILGNSYSLGSSAYLLLSLGRFDYDDFQKFESLSELHYQPVYNGTLFRWAYLRPDLQEEVYAFRIEQMEKVPNEVIYNWLQHSQNIFCLGYDQNGRWLDKTVPFREKIQQEKQRRGLLVSNYDPIAASSLNGRVIYTKTLIFPDQQLCQYECDQKTGCKGFTYENAEYRHHSTVKCQFYDQISQAAQRFCPTCIGFVKERH